MYQRLFIFFSLIFLLLWFSSCLKKELPVPPHHSGNVITATIPLTSNYKYQIFFSLNNNQIVQQQYKTSWDIAFEGKDKRVILNSSKFMFACNTKKNNFSEVLDTNGFSKNKKYDTPTGNLDSTAIGKWWENNFVYIIDRGYNENGIHLGFRKLKILSYNNGVFSFAFCKLTDTIATTYTITTDTNYRFVGFNFDSQQKVYCEPPKNQWDIVFTQYTETLSEPYLVTGCLLNRPYVSATITINDDFDNINYNKAIQYILTTNANIIGYNWKTYDFNSSSYIVYPNKIYIIKGWNHYYYKLRFIDFYSTTGEKGYPKFEYQRL
ncbi:MAG: hypothetical protein N2203_03555 [Bacteroidia bacterium]|nr:hypothetical protein [Bacteroidia bacterium]